MEVGQVHLRNKVGKKGSKTIFIWVCSTSKNFVKLTVLNYKVINEV